VVKGKAMKDAVLATHKEFGLGAGGGN